MLIEAEKLCYVALKNVRMFLTPHAFFHCDAAAIACYASNESHFYSVRDRTSVHLS